MKIEFKISNTLLFLLSSWLLVGGSLYNLYQSRLQEFISYQHDISDQSLKVIADEIGGYLDRRRDLLSLFIANNVEILQTLGRFPSDSAAGQRVENGIRNYFGETVGFTLADLEGRTLLRGIGSPPGHSCRADIKNFSGGGRLNEVFIHTNPDPKKFHFDILGMVKSINSVIRVMGRQCIAEFVENEDVVAALKRIGVDYAQSYHIHKPEELENIIPARQSPSA